MTIITSQPPMAMNEKDDHPVFTECPSLLGYLTAAAVSPEPDFEQEPFRRRVSFACEATVATHVPPSSSLSESERERIWYTQTDLSDFKETARSLSRQMRRNQISPLEMESCTRGLEHRVSLERQRHKLITIRAIMEAQRRLVRSPKYEEKLALISRKCSKFATNIALTTGQQDFFDAYPMSEVNRGLKRQRVCDDDEVVRCIRRCAVERDFHEEMPLVHHHAPSYLRLR